MFYSLTHDLSCYIWCPFTTTPTGPITRIVPDGRSCQDSLAEKGALVGTWHRSSVTWLTLFRVCFRAYFKKACVLSRKMGL